MTGRRVVQYLIDAFLVGLIPSLVSIPFDRSNSTLIHVLGGIVAFVVFVVIGLMYWVIFAHRQNGQTLGMKLLGLRVVSKGGGPASMAQLFIRWICLILDAIPYTWPFTGLVGFVVILCSRDRQRIGDHLARTLVISTTKTVSGPR
ncbi:MAG TPA: RDD family protein [Streptosporangiaceae bacterium]